MSQNDGRVVSNFIVQALKNEPITIYGKGDQSRSFCYVSDLVDGIYKLVTIAKPIATPINLGNPKEFTVLELAKLVIEITGSNSEIIYKSLPQDDPMQRRPDILKAKELLRWEPKIQLEEGIARTANFFKSVI
jgi:UDP-glucuronate decarboxylase